MSALTVRIVLGLVSLALVAGLCWLALRRTRSEPRRLSNGVLLGLAFLLAVDVLAGLGSSGASLASVLIGVLVALSPFLVLVLSVLLIINGAQMVRRESRSLGNLLALLLGLALLFLCVLPVLVVLAHGGTVAIAITGFLLILAAYFSFVLINFVIYSAIYRRIVAGRSADWVVVLGSGLGEGGRVPPLLASRIRTGLAQATRVQARTLVMAGGKGEDELLPEAEAMAAWAVDQGADPRRIRIENRSRSTEENLRFTRELLGPEAADPGLIVTSNYHAMRAALLARRLGLSAQAFGAPTAGYYWPSAILREFVAIVARHRWAHLVAGLIVAVPIPALVLLVR